MYIIIFESMALMGIWGLIILLQIRLVTAHATPKYIILM